MSAPERKPPVTPGAHAAPAGAEPAAPADDDRTVIADYDGTLQVTVTAAGVVAGGGWGSWQIITNLHSAYQNRRVRARIRLPGSESAMPVRWTLEKFASMRAWVTENTAIRTPITAISSRMPP